MKQRINITIERDLHKKAKAFCDKNKTNLSQLIEVLLLSNINNKTMVDKEIRRMSMLNLLLEIKRQIDQETKKNG